MSRAAGLQLQAPRAASASLLQLVLVCTGHPTDQQRRRKPKPAFHGYTPEAPGGYSTDSLRRDTKPAARERAVDRWGAEQL